MGKVYSATNAKNELVAVKMVERGPKTALKVNEEIHILQSLTQIPESKNNRCLVRLREVIYQNGTDLYDSTCFDDVALVLEPLASGTFEELMDISNNKSAKSVFISPYKLRFFC
jgi:hypothetical protein